MLRIGIIGSGWVAGIHISALKMQPNAQVVAIASRNTIKAEALALDIKANVYENHLVMLKKEKLDAVFICLPPHLHGQLEIDCSEYVRGVLVEKPICNELEQAYRINAAFDKAGTITAAAYMMRYHKSVERARELFFLKGNGAIIVDAWFIAGMPGPSWWRNKEQSGGQFVEQCTHLVDTARYLMGEITEVSATTTRGFIKETPGYTGDDAMAVQVKFESGAVGTFTTGCFLPEGMNDVGMKVISKDILCKFTGWGMDAEIIHANGEKQSFESIKIGIFNSQAEAFLKAVETNDQSFIRSSYLDGVKTLKVTLAANESARTGMTIRL